jgi:hypothetical protein
MTLACEAGTKAGAFSP